MKPFLRCAAGAVGLFICACSDPPPTTGEAATKQKANTGGVSMAAAPPSTTAPACTTSECTRLGEFGPPFAEPTIDATQLAPPESPDNPLHEWPDAERCQVPAADDPPPPADCRCLYDHTGDPVKCKPTAGSVALLRDGRVLYFNALEGTERVEYSIFFEAGHALQNDQTRVMTLGRTVTWAKPQPNDGGAENPDPETLLDPGVLNNEFSDKRDNDGALFCADLAHVAGGRVLAVGGTDYYNEPGVDEPFPLGISELEGLKNARLFDPATNTWSQTGHMAHGRWYPTVVNLADGDVLVASGVTKLLKPLYPGDAAASGRNVAATETWNLCSGQWRDNGASAQRSLPLYPRLHLLPDGRVLYNAAGQAFNPFGQAYDQATWNFVAAYDPSARAWTEVGFAGLPPNPLADPVATASLAPGAGFRGSTFSMMLPLVPDADGRYRKVELLTAGGVTGNVVLTSPGSNQPTAHSRIDTVTVADDGTLRYDSRATGALNAARWYGTGVLLPTGDVMVFSGADRDEVQFPGTGMPILTTERFDRASDRWKTMADQGRPRTYHNTAMLLPDGRVLVGGHAPINTLYGYSVTLPGFSPNDGRDPSFEIYSPPYVFGPRPAVTSSDPKTLRPGEEFTIATHQAASVTSVVLVRRTDLTHLVDADQRSVLLPIVGRNPGKELRARMPAQRAVVPPGEYMLFIVAPGPHGPAPSVSVPVTVRANRDC